MAKFDPMLSLDCARVEGAGAQSKERRGSNFAAQRSGDIVLQARRAKHIHCKNLAITIWQPKLCRLPQAWALSNEQSTDPAVKCRREEGRYRLRLPNFTNLSLEVTGLKMLN